MRLFLSIIILLALAFVLGFSHNYVIKVVGNVINYLDTNTKEQTCLKECLPLGCKITEINCIKSNSENCIRICNITQPKFVDDFIEKNFKK